METVAFIAFQWVMISVILACLWGAGMAVTYGCMWLQQTFSPGSALIKATFLASMKQTKGLAFASAFGASLSLGFVLCFTHVLRFVVRRQINRRAIKTATRPITGITPTLAQLATVEAVSSGV